MLWICSDNLKFVMDLSKYRVGSTVRDWDGFIENAVYLVVIATIPIGLIILRRLWEYGEEVEALPKALGAKIEHNGEASSTSAVEEVEEETGAKKVVRGSVAKRIVLFFLDPLNIIKLAFVLFLLAIFGRIVDAMVVELTGIEHRFWQTIPSKLLGAFGVLCWWVGCLQFLHSESPQAFRTMLIASGFAVYGISRALETTIWHCLQTFYGNLVDVRPWTFFAICQSVYFFLLLLLLLLHFCLERWKIT